MRIKISSSTNGDDIVSVADLKAYLRVGGSDDDALIQALRDAAIKYVESHCNTHLGVVTATGYMDAFYPAHANMGPVVSVTGVTYLNINGDETDLNSAHFYVDTESDLARIEFDNPPTLFDHGFNKVRVAMTIGYAVDAIPTPILQALNVLVAHMYDNRFVFAAGRNVQEVPFAVTALLNGHRFLA